MNLMVCVRFSERDHVVNPSVVCLSSVTFVHAIQQVKIFGNVSMPFGTLSIYWYLCKILPNRSSVTISVKFYVGGGVREED